jgi:putative transposase
MARHPRLVLPGQMLHMTQRGNNRQAVFFDDADYALYRDWLAEAAQANGPRRRTGCASMPMS